MRTKVGICILGAVACLIFLYQWLSPSPELDPSLQSLSQTAILRTQKVIVPGYPKAFNPSLIAYGEGYLLSFRVRHKVSPKQKPLLSRSKDISFVGVVKLDKSFKAVAQSAQLLEITSYSSQLSATAEDARLLNIGGRIYIFFNDLPLSETQGHYALYYGELIEKEGTFVLKEQAKPLNYAQAVPIEKNWSPFTADGKLYLIYSDAPRVILEVDRETGNCSEVARTPSQWRWQWGEIRGGTPALLLADGYFLTFFHSSIPVDPFNKKKGRIYVMGAYTFEKNLPFSPLAVTPSPVGQPQDYTKENQHKVVFPGGLVIENDFIYVAWGKNNKQVCLTVFDKKKLLDSMEPF